MTKYAISFENPLSQFFIVKSTFNCEGEDGLSIALPNWRPGRYQIQHFVKRTKNVQAFDEHGKSMAIYKTDLANWEVKTKDSKSITFQFEYHAAHMDAGNSWLDHEQLYINFINCMPFIEDRRNEPCEVSLKLPEHYQIACGLTQPAKHKLYAPSYNILIDSPMFASSNLRLIPYEVDGKTYNIWFQGEMPRTDEELIQDFEAFTKKTTEIMGELPCDTYHFLNQSLPYRHYHGVEHWNSTVIVIGPSAELAQRERYSDFLGVSCHELFHTWNVIRLRPEEMTPYELQKPNLHYTGFITEGVTTYYGDLILARSGVYTLEEYIEEINKLLKRHFENDGRKNYSVADSSFDLWIDGYEKGTPGRKVSIYNEGALAAMIMDLRIRKKFDNKKSLDDVMRLMWQRHGKSMEGYSWIGYKRAVEDVFQDPTDEYFEKIIFGHDDYATWLFPLLNEFGIPVQTNYPENSIEKDFGFKLEEQIVTAIEGGSPAAKGLMLKDKVIETTASSDELNLNVERHGVQMTLSLTKSSQSHFALPQVDIDKVETKSPLLQGWLLK